jgi:hypothetical protein
MTGTNCDLFTHKSSRSYLNHLVQPFWTNVQNLKKTNGHSDEKQLGQLSPCSYSMQAGVSRARIAAGQRDFLFSDTWRQTLKLTQSPIPWVPGFVPGGKEAGACI